MTEDQCQCEFQSSLWYETRSLSFILRHMAIISSDWSAIPSKQFVVSATMRFHGSRDDTWKVHMFFPNHAVLLNAALS